jgi:hypothetical protein
VKDPYPQLLLSALAIDDKQNLIGHLSASVASAPVMDQLAYDLNDLHAQPEDRPDPLEAHEVYSPEWPELYILVPMSGLTGSGDGKAGCPIVNWLSALGPGECPEVN